MAACKSDNTPVEDQHFNSVYRELMREFVQDLSAYARSIREDFIVIPQNGQQLCKQQEMPAMEYLAAIDGQGREELFYGFGNADDEPTPAEERDLWQPDLELMRDHGIKILITDYCSTQSHVDYSYTMNENLGFISYAADDRELNTIASYPAQAYNENENNINSLSDAKNFLYLINTNQYNTKSALIDALSETNYDAIIMDAFFDEEEYTQAEIQQLQLKANGGRRLVIAYMSIGEAEDYRYYWQPHWSFNPPDWVHSANADWPGNYKVEYWNNEWQEIIFGNDESYLKRILNKGFDGVYLDIIDAFEYWEDL